MIGKPDQLDFGELGFYKFCGAVCGVVVNHNNFKRLQSKYRLQTRPDVLPFVARGDHHTHRGNKFETPFFTCLLPAHASPCPGVGEQNDCVNRA